MGWACGQAVLGVVSEYFKMNSVIQDAVSAGDFGYFKTILTSLLQKEPYVVNTPVDDEGTTLLHLAANCTSPHIMKLLLECHADVDWQNNDGLTALHVAAMWGKGEMVLLLLDYGASPSVYDDDEMLPIDYARKQDHKYCIKVLEESSQRVKADHDVSVAEAFVSLFTEKGPAQNKPLRGIDHSDMNNCVVQHGPDSVRSKSMFSLSVLPEKSLGTEKGCIHANESADINIPTQNSHTTAASEDEIVAVPKDIEELSNIELKQELLDLGEYPGPITETTRSAYLVYLTKLRNGVQPAGNKGYKGFKYELSLVLNGTVSISDLTSVEFNFNPSSSTTVIHHKKDCFNYLLLDPRSFAKDFSVTDGVKHEIDHFKEFVESIFYVGKGKNARSMQHLKEAKEGLVKNGKLSVKTTCIVNIWKKGYGILSLPVFHNITENDAFSREACIIDAIGLRNLANIQRGHVHGEVCIWPRSKRRLFGVILLYQAFQMYKLSNPQPLYPTDV